MALKLTKGNLAQAKLVNLTSGTESPCMFNPSEYTLTKHNAWESKPLKGKNVPQVTFTQGGSQVLKLTLYFDSQAENTDVRLHTDPLWDMMMVTEQEKNARSNKSQPPGVAFEWGKLYFKAVLTDITQKFTLFNEQGTPIRCQVDISLEQMIDADEGKGSGGGGATVVAMIAGQRLDNVAPASSSSSSAPSTRQVAADNNINNPLRVPSGTPIKL